jgi:predicted alpha-1,6-mannanase (GH76 family)
MDLAITGKENRKILWNSITRRRFYLFILTLLIVSFTRDLSMSAGTVPRQNGMSYDRRATLAVQTLQSWYDSDTGLYRTAGWWNAANAITVLADYSRITESRQYESVFSNTLSAAQRTHPQFINRYYDDEGWWALAWIQVYDLTKEDRYLAMANSIFSDMIGGWDNTCSGGIWWSKDRKYKNAIANELFFSVAAHLAIRTANEQDRTRDLAWATKESKWFSHSGMINASHLVNDGLTRKCRNNHRTTWSYNQGVIIGALVELYRANHDSALLSRAATIAGAALSHLTDARGILHDRCEPDCGADGTQFKGIFVRNLRSLDEEAPLRRYKKFVYTNADSIWTGAHSPDYHLGPVWAAPFGAANAISQSSALDVIVSAAEIEQKSIR